MKTPKTILCASQGELYIQAKHCGIHSLIVLMDGFSLCYFNRRKRSVAYLRVPDVIKWHEDELKLRKLSEREEENLKLLRAAFASFQQHGIQDGQIRVLPA